MTFRETARAVREALAKPPPDEEETPAKKAPAKKGSAKKTPAKKGN
jgi:hypothetical protein